MYNYNELYVYHHLGLGDHIICNGLVRNICKKIKTVNLFCKPEYSPSVNFMYHDLENLKIIEGNDKSIPLLLNDIHIQNKIIIGFDAFHHNHNNEKFDKFFYSSIGLNFEKRWSDFYVSRDLKREEKLYNTFGIEGEYAFIHEDRSRGYYVDKNKISNGLQLLSPDINYTSNIFDYLMLIENAKEIHVIDSCFKQLIETTDVKGNLFFHTSKQYNESYLLHTSKKPWIII